MESASAPFRLGIYGGTFAPPHIGHIRAAVDFREQASLDRLLVMPAFLPPHKQIDPGDDPAVRLRMAHAAFDGLDERISVSDFEIRRGGVSYTFETLTHFARTTEAELFFLVGTDMFVTLDRWRNPDIIFSLARIACVMREEGEEAYALVQRKNAEYRERFGARTMFVHSEPIVLSSSEIRERIRRGESVGGRITPAVETIIREGKLYQDPEERGFKA